MTLFADDELELEPNRAVPTGPLLRVRMLVAYDGTGFSGFARQPGAKTVAGSLEEALGRVLGRAVRLTCAGRTDAGVHAWGQVVHFDSVPDVGGADVDLAALQRSLNRMLKPAIVVRDAAVAADGFDARRSATARRYRYTVVNRPVPDPFLSRTAWHVEAPLDVRSMQAAADPVIGEHDFSSFCRRPPGLAGDADPLVRRVRDAQWVDLGDGVLRFDIEASSFCHQMVRSIVGLLVEVGVGRKRAGDVAEVIRARDRAGASQIAPPHGLCLWEVVY